MNNKSKIFDFLYKRHSESYNINQISRLIGISVGSSFKILKELEKEGYVIANKKNNALLYQINMSDKAKKVYSNIEEEENKKGKKRTKVMCTIGNISNIVMIKKLAEAGMDVARVDVSGLDERAAFKITQNIRQASDDIPIMLDIGSKSAKDWAKFAVKNDLDFISAYAKNAGEIQQINKLFGYTDIKQVIGDKIKVIAKIGKHSLNNYKEIIEESYGVIIDRSRLPVKIELLPKLQKEIADECNKHGKPLVIAGNVLKSMADSKQPLQAEVYDISNSVLEGASCIMLSEEASSGKYPLEAAETISKIVKGAEMYKIESNDADYDLTHFIGKAVSELEKILRINALLIITSGGYSARMISSRRLKCRTIAATSRKKIFRQIHLLWGIEPLYANISAEDISDRDKKEVMLKALKKGFIGKRDQIAVIASIFHSKYKRTNLLEIHNVSEFLDYLNKNEELNLEAYR